MKEVKKKKEEEYVLYDHTDRKSQKGYTNDRKQISVHLGLSNSRAYTSHRQNKVVVVLTTKFWNSCYITVIARKRHKAIPFGSFIPTQEIFCLLSLFLVGRRGQSIQPVDIGFLGEKAEFSIF